MDPTHVVNQIMALKEHADSARKLHAGKWTNNWARYNSEQNWAGKLWWQSKTLVPRIPIMVDFAATRMQLAMQTAGRWFAFEPHSDSSRPAAQAAEALVRDPLEGPAVDLSSKVASQTRASLLTGSGIFKVRWDNGLCVDETDAFDYWEDPTRRKRYVIERVMRDIDEIRRWADEGRVDRAAAGAIKGGDGQSAEMLRRRRAGLLHPSSVPGRKEVELTEFWGDLIGESGNLIERNCFAIVAEGKHLLVPPTPNPFRHGQPPYVRVIPIPAPHGVYGQALVSDVGSLAEMYQELLNLLMDAAMLDAITAWEVNVNNAEDPTQLLAGIAPGRAYETTTAEWLIRPIQKDTSGAATAMAIANFIIREIENDTSLTEFVRGTSTGGGDLTATEYVGKSQQGGAFLQGLSERFQNQGIARVAEMSCSVIAQYQPAETYTTPRYVHLLGPQAAYLLANLSDDERYRWLCENHVVRGRGVSGVFMRQEQHARVMQFIQLVSMIPGLAQMINWDGLLERGAEAMGFESRDVLMPPGQRQQLPQIAGEQAGQEQQSAGALRGSGRGGKAWQGPLEREPKRAAPAQLVA